MTYRKTSLRQHQKNILRQLPKELRSRVAALRSMSYDEYLLTPEWRKKRLKRLEKSHFKCDECGSNNDLQVHHKTYIRRGFERITDLRTLCKRCHLRQHGLLPPKHKPGDVVYVPPKSVPGTMKGAKTT